MDINEAFQLARRHHLAGNLEAAEHIYTEILRIQPSNVGAYYEIGDVFQDKGQLEEAAMCYQKTIELNPNFAGAYNNLGNIFRKRNKFNEAILCFQKAIELAPNFWGTYYNLGDVYHEKEEIDKAIFYYRKAVELNPDHATSYNNLGNALKDKGEFDEAIRYYRKALCLNPIAADTHLNFAFALLLSGDFKEGWKEYEWRQKTDAFIYLHRHSFAQPVWDGSDIAGRTILLYAEQGFGDTIQFIRYVPLLAKREATIIVECRKELVSLLKNVEGVHQVVTLGERLPMFDTYSALLSLPLMFATTLENIPSKIPYITMNPELILKWKRRIEHDSATFRIGLTWSGNPTKSRDHYRSCHLDIFSPLAKLNNTIFYSLQKGEAGKQATNPPKGMNLIDLTHEINDFSDTAALIERLDLVISVDTAVAHLAGALGKPVWTLLPFNPDWRWLLDRDDSPWYPTMRLFRQPSPGDWGSVIVKVGDNLLKLLGSN